MPTRETIIDNISQYTSRQVLDFLKNRNITIEEILEGNPGDFDYLKRKEVEQLLWDEVFALRDRNLVAIYIENYPKGTYIVDALQLQEGILPPAEETSEIPEPYYESESDFSPADPWDTVDKESVESLNMFLELNPDHRMAKEARKLLNKLITRLRKEADIPRGPEWLKRELAASTKNPVVLANIIIDGYDNDRITNSELKSMLAEDPNFLPLPAIEILVEEGILSTVDLLNAGIDNVFVNTVAGNNYDLVHSPVNTDFMVNPERINQVCQEVYFWGMPSSGKTCALGAILSAASTGRVAKTIEKNPSCNGYDYMRQLSEIFVPGKVSVVPPGTSASFVSDMSFWLLDDDEKLHSVTMIDLAGEMLHAMYLVDQNRFNELSPDQQKGYQCMKQLLVDSSSKNSKIHFFVLEYGGHERREKGIRQVDMLDGALSHIKNLGILKNTDAVFILLTKADKAFSQPGDITQVLTDYVKTHYQAFYNNLRLNTKHINGGKVEMIPFSIGEVCFQDLCRFDDETANDIVRLFLERTVGEKTGKFGKFTKSLRQ